MTPQRDIERLLDAWLADGPTEVSERTFDEAVERIHRQSQRRAWRSSWRDLPVNAYLKPLAAMTAVIVVAVVGWNVLPGRAPGIVGATAAAPSRSPSVTPSLAVPVAPVEFTGQITCGPPVSPYRATEETLDVGDDGMSLTRSRRGAWHQTVTMSDPRIEGTVYQTYESDGYRMPGAANGPGVFAATRRIENDEGAWETRYVGGTFSDGSPIGASEFEAPTVYIGQGAYEGLIAIVETTIESDICAGDVRGMIFAGAPTPEPYHP